MQDHVTGSFLFKLTILYAVINSIKSSKEVGLEADWTSSPETYAKWPHQTSNIIGISMMGSRREAVGGLRERDSY